ncbi:MAG: hypothetical protein V4655_07215 [Bdellovibrionota bacterium]
MSDKMVSFRDYLRECLNPLRSQLGSRFQGPDYLTEVILMMASYQEEGTDLFPVVFMADSMDHFKNHLGAREMVLVGEGQPCRETFIRAFKLCAPLAEDRLWAVYILLEEQGVRYGIFRSDSSPLSPSVFERLRGLKAPGTSIVGLTRLGGNFVEIRTSLGQHKYVNVASSDEDDYHPGQVIRDFVDSVCSDVSDSVRPLLKSFYQRFGMDVLHGSHGSLIAIIRKGEKIPEILQDGVPLNPPISIVASIEGIINGSDDRDAYLRLFSYGQLLRKLTWMDGITILDTEGCILAFNCFIKTSAYRAEDSIIGGARRRAYGHMQTNVPGILAGCLYKSQDGHIEFKGDRCGLRSS